MAPSAEEGELQEESQVGGGRAEGGGGRGRLRSHDQGLEKLELAKSLLLERAAGVDVDDVRSCFAWCFPQAVQPAVVSHEESGCSRRGLPRAPVL